MIAAQLNTLCAAYSNVDGATLHDGDPGPAGLLNDMGYTKQTVTWSTPAAGEMTASVAFTDVMGEGRYIVLWDGTVFIDSLPCVFSFSDEADLLIVVKHRVRES